MLELVECDFPIKEVDRLRIIFSRVDVNILNGVSFLPLEKLLDLKPYRCSLLRGLIPSMGKYFNLFKLLFYLFRFNTCLDCQAHTGYSLQTFKAYQEKQKSTIFMISPSN